MDQFNFLFPDTDPSDFFTDEDSDYATVTSQSMDDADFHAQLYSHDSSWSGSTSETPTPRSGMRSESRSITPLMSPPQIDSFETERKTVEEVLSKYVGSDVASLRNLATALARESIFGREEMAKKSLSGRKNTDILDKEKVDYIKTLVRSRVPNTSQVEFEHVWTLCRKSLSKSCQTLRNSAKKRL